MKCSTLRIVHWCTAIKGGLCTGTPVVSLSYSYSRNLQHANKSDVPTNTAAGGDYTRIPQAMLSVLLSSASGVVLAFSAL